MRPPQEERSEATPATHPDILTSKCRGEFGLADSHIHALGARVHTSAFGTTAESILPLEDEFTPLAPRPRAGEILLRRDAVTVNDLGENLHPAVLVLSAVGIKVNDLAVVEANAETLFDEHIALFFLGKGRASTLPALARGLLFCERTTVINQPFSVGKVDCGARLSCCFVVCCELSANKLKISAAPVLCLC